MLSNISYFIWWLKKLGRLVLIHIALIIRQLNEDLLSIWCCCDLILLNWFLRDILGLDLYWWLHINYLRLTVGRIYWNSNLRCASLNRLILAWLCWRNQNLTWRVLLNHLCCHWIDVLPSRRCLDKTTLILRSKHGLLTLNNLHASWRRQIVLS